MHAPESLAPAPAAPAGSAPAHLELGGDRRQPIGDALRRPVRQEPHRPLGRAARRVARRVRCGGAGVDLGSAARLRLRARRCLLPRSATAACCLH